MNAWANKGVTRQKPSPRAYSLYIELMDLVAYSYERLVSDAFESAVAKIPGLDIQRSSLAERPHVIHCRRALRPYGLQPNDGAGGGGEAHPFPRDVHNLMGAG